VSCVIAGTRKTVVEVKWRWPSSWRLSNERVSQNRRKFSRIFVVELPDAKHEVCRYRDEEGDTDKDRSDDLIKMAGVATTDKGHPLLVQDISIAQDCKAYESINNAKVARNVISRGVEQGGG